MATPTPQLPSPVLAPRPRFFSAIWLVPLAAAVIGLWLAYTSYRDRGPEILIRFTTGAGIVPGKTPIKYHGVTVGMVKHIELDTPSGEVNVRARLNQDSEDFACEDTQFWMVSPRISLKEASGLDTLLSGQYITLRPGQGEPLYRFKALEAPPAGGMNAPGLHLVLLVDEIGALSAGAPVLHRDVRVGQVTHFDPPTDAGPIRLHLNIEENYAALVRQNTRFWNASGLSLDAGLDGFRFRMESISSVIEGGVAFSIAPGATPGEPATNDTVFPLHPDRETALEAGPVVRIDCVEPEGVRSGTPVRWRGAPAGRVRSVRLRAGLSGAELEVALKPEAADLARVGALYWLVRPGFNEAGAHGLAALATGPYLEAAAGLGAVTNRFVCAEEPPVFLPDAPGLHLVLLTPRALPRGTPIRSRGVRVGELQGSEFDAQTGWLTAHATVEKSFAKLLTGSASFWLEDGARVEANWNGVRAVVPSLAGLITTGVAVEIVPGGKPAQDGMIFPLHDSRKEAMPEGLALTLRMAEAKGLLVGALVNYRGVEIGEVEGLDAKPDDPTHPVHARLRLQKGMEAFATGDARFWLVEPQLGLHSSSNLFAYVTGPWLEARPGTGARVESVDVRAAADWKREAPPVVLRTSRATGVDAGDPVFFMGVEAGEITARALEDDGASVRLEARLQPAFQPYLRADSRFFEREGLRVTGGLGGLTVETGSLSSLVAGGVGFYNPPGPGTAATGSAQYPLHVSETSARAGGRPFSLTLPEARGLARGAEVKYQGVSIGKVEAVRLLPDRSGVAADLRLHDGMDDFARANARYWLVSADISLRGVRDPETLVTGPYLAALPGAGDPTATLRALPSAPGGEEPGLNLVLRVNRSASLTAGVAVLYRDLPVGRVTGVDLAPRGDHVRVGIRIAPRYTGLVTVDSRFWNAGGFGMNVGLFGAKVRSSTLESLLSGAISFATPSPGSAPAEGTEFSLAQEPQDDWLKWNPALPVAEAP